MSRKLPPTPSASWPTLAGTSAIPVTSRMVRMSRTVPSSETARTTETSFQSSGRHAATKAISPVCASQVGEPLTASSAVNRRDCPAATSCTQMSVAESSTRPAPSRHPTTRVIR